MDVERIKIGFGKFFLNQYMKVICIPIMYAINGRHNLKYVVFTIATKRMRSIRVN